MCHLSVLLFYKHLYYNIIILLLKRYIQKPKQMVIEEHETSIRLEMFIVQFDRLLRQHVSFSPLSIFALLLQSHSAHQWYFRYLKITGFFLKTAKFISYTSAVREPETEGKEKNDVFCCCFSWKTTRSVRWGNRKYARLPLGLFWRGSAVTLQQLL